MPGLALSCLPGLFVGGALGGLALVLFQQIRARRVKIPPTVAIGPLKLDISALVPKTEGEAEEADLSSMAPLLEGGGSISSGCLSLVSAAMVLVGFLLPWFTCNIGFLISGSFSGFSMLLQLVAGVLLSGLGAVGGGSDGAAAGGVLTLLLILLTIFLALTPSMGLYIGRTGLRLIQSPKSSNEQRRKTSKRPTRAAVAGLTPLLRYLASATANFSGLSALGASINTQSADTGLWVTLIAMGFYSYCGRSNHRQSGLFLHYPYKSGRRDDFRFYVAQLHPAAS